MLSEFNLGMLISEKQRRFIEDSLAACFGDIALNFDGEKFTADTPENIDKKDFQEVLKRLLFIKRDIPPRIQKA